MPKLTHSLNGFRAVRAIGMSPNEMVAKHTDQGARLAEQYPELHLVRELFEQACDRAELVYALDTFDDDVEDVDEDMGACWVCGGDGYGTRGDFGNDDPINESDDDIIPCPNCKGSGDASDCWYW